MAEFQELIKNFDRIRDFMRQFYVYGFKVRNDFSEKSSRTYDNERRRIESWLSRYTKSDYTSKGKHVYINVDSKTIPQNPLYAAWKSKSFTDNDIMLHFFILDLLWDCPEGMSSGAVTDLISHNYGVVFDTQTVRLKLKEYETLGILVSHKEGKTLSYSLSPLMPMETGTQRVNSGVKESDEAMEPDKTEDGEQGLWQCLMTAVKYFQEAAPFGCIGSTILDRQDESNDLFQFKHHFIVHTLEDGILSDILAAIRQQRLIRFENKSSRSGQISTLSGVPLKIFVSTQTGRRYLCLYLPERRRFSNSRLDSITRVTLLEPCTFYEEVLRDLEKNKEKCWGVSFGGGTVRIEEVCIKLYIDEEKEPYILNRLYREGRGGEVQKICENQFLYTGTFFDTNEMLSWIKTFTGRIMDIQGTNLFSIAKITRDWEKMYEMYCENEE